jgi:hypothetical protein
MYNDKKKEKKERSDGIPGKDSEWFCKDCVKKSIKIHLFCIFFKLRNFCSLLYFWQINNLMVKRERHNISGLVVCKKKVRRRRRNTKSQET